MSHCDHRVQQLYFYNKSNVALFIEPVSYLIYSGRLPYFRDALTCKVTVGGDFTSTLLSSLLYTLASSEAEFINVLFLWGFLAYSWDFSGLRFPYTMFTSQTSFKPLLQGGGGWNPLVEVTLQTFVSIPSKNSASVRFAPVRRRF